MRTLVLNAGFEPLAVVSFKRALVLVMNQKATIIAADAEHPVWGSSGSYDRPSVLCAHPEHEVDSGQPSGGAAPGQPAVRVLRWRCEHDRPRAASLARWTGHLGEPRGLLFALQQCQERSHAGRDGLESAGETQAAARNVVACAWRRARRVAVGRVPRAGRVARRASRMRPPAKLDEPASVAQWKSSSVLRKRLGVRVPPGAPEVRGLMGVKRALLTLPWVSYG
jgi:hypothetical protein